MRMHRRVAERQQLEEHIMHIHALIHRAAEEKLTGIAAILRHRLHVFTDWLHNL